ncbi:MAG TPA: protein phosphatase 2C domain-containing protein [Acetivibrio sp.]|uniref:PP2C family protein-serine/threonine phosphatase n=1 Tax=Acetivibrio sp. TaxID=1872092 RepID=UPI002BA45324|nr:protein phosphatase 2C domain-containing protein [Acetivibrio sp.]HOM02743.1 protein phosphatase 2C domain-containing protein [Acetivibrio sp.]
MYSEKNLILRASAATNIGFIRSANEDNFYLNGVYFSPYLTEKTVLFDINEADSFFLFAVSDGMGGEAFGDKASHTAMLELKKAHNNLKSNNIGNIEDCVNIINSYVKNTNNLIYNLGVEYGARTGTTFASLVLYGDRAQALNLGDSRIYHVRGNEITQLTRDHTEAERLVRLGILSPKEASSSPRKHLLYKFLGIPPEAGIVEADTSEVIDVKKGDAFLLCTDGLTNMVNIERIKNIITTGNTSSKIASMLVNQALINGGVDNITCIVVKVEDILM